MVRNLVTHQEEAVIYCWLKFAYARPKDFILLSENSNNTPRLSPWYATTVGISPRGISTSSKRARNRGQALDDSVISWEALSGWGRMQFGGYLREFCYGWRLCGFMLWWVGGWDEGCWRSGVFFAPRENALGDTFIVRIKTGIACQGSTTDTLCVSSRSFQHIGEAIVVGALCWCYVAF